MSATIPENLTPVRAIRAKCVDCSGGSRSAVRECHLTECPLYKFRMGKNPNYLSTKTEQEDI